jgi:hypothetical protein
MSSGQGPPAEIAAWLLKPILLSQLKLNPIALKRHDALWCIQLNSNVGRARLNGDACKSNRLKSLLELVG